MVANARTRGFLLQPAVARSEIAGEADVDVDQPASTNPRGEQMNAEADPSPAADRSATSAGAPATPPGRPPARSISLRQTLETLPTN